jgi:3-(3-hydroxy-phenyl)propionate hydroxylase
VVGEIVITVDTVIIGGGPVGCLLSVLLSDMGVTNAVIDRDLEPYQLPRAIVMDDEAQRIFHDHGMGEWLQSNTSPLEAADFVDADGKRIMGMEVPPVGLQGLPPVVCHFQPDVDTMLRQEAQRRGARVFWGVEPTSLIDDDGGIQVVLSNGDEVHARWAVGCDGASSWTRKTVGLILEDLRFDQQWLVVDIALKDNSTCELPVGVRQYCDPVRPATYVKGHRNYRRWEFQVQEHEDTDALNTEDGLWLLLAPWVTRADADIVRSAVYRFHAVVAPEMQKGNVFLAGDSGHQMPPFMGQGLNSGMRDAANLAWKMSFVKRGLVPDSFLSTYSEERVPHVRSIVAHAVDVGRLIDQLAGRVSHGVEQDAGYGGARPQPFLESGFVTGDDPRVGHQFWHREKVSRGLRMNGASLAFVVHEPVDLPSSFEELAQIVVDPDAVGNDYAIVVRPDRYVSAVAKNASDLIAIAKTLNPYSD